MKVQERRGFDKTRLWHPSLPSYPACTVCRHVPRSITWQPNEKRLTIFYEYGALSRAWEPRYKHTLLQLIISGTLLMCLLTTRGPHSSFDEQREIYLRTLCVSSCDSSMWITSAYFFTRGFSLCHAVGSTSDLKPSTLIKQSETLNLFWT